VIKNFIILFGALLLAFTPNQNIKAETQTKATDWYTTTEDIVLDLIMPTIDKRVIKEYGGDALFDWQLRRIVGITYNHGHSYDVSVSIIIPRENESEIEDFAKVRIYMPCDSAKINQKLCNHGFKMEIMEYKNVSPS
jgi:hypothetical protein